jgi:hypothetical protein
MLSGTQIAMQVAAKIVEIGSMKLDLHSLALRIFNLCLANRINLEIQWIPRTENEKADYISRLIDTDDWQITEELFAVIDSLWGPHSVDAMATYCITIRRFPSSFQDFGILIQLE